MTWPDEDPILDVEQLLGRAWEPSTAADLRWHYGLKPLTPGVGVVLDDGPPGRPVQTWAKWYAITRGILNDELIVRVVVHGAIEDLYRDVAAGGCRWAGDPVVTLTRPIFPVMLMDDPRGRLRRLWDRIRRRTWTPPRAPYTLLAEVRAA